jgi:hypothetical protein
MKVAIRFLVLMLAALYFSAPPASAQPAEEEVQAVVQRLFEGMRAGDSTAVRSVFHPDARMLSVGVRDGQPALMQGNVEEFVRAIGTPHEDVWDERVWDVEIRIDGNLAAAWMDYAFYLGDEFSHCGVNAFHLFHGPEGWKIIGITDTRRKDGCEVSPSEG